MGQAAQPVARCLVIVVAIVLVVADVPVAAESTTLPSHVAALFPQVSELPILKPYIGITRGTFDSLNSSALVEPPLADSNGLTLYSFRNRPLVVAINGRGRVVFARSHQYTETPKKDVATNRARSYLAFRMIDSANAAIIARAGGFYYPGLFNIYTGMATFVPRHEPWMSRTLHHDMRWNPKTETFLVMWLKRVNRWAYGMQRSMADNGLYEINLEGRVVWELDLSVPLLPYWLTYVRTLGICNGDQSDATDKRCTDYLHCNTAFWDVDDDAIYVNSRRLSTFFKIRKTTKQVEWGLGLAGDFKLWEDGKKVDSMFSGAHEVMKIGPRVFAMLDNNAWSEEECEQSRKTRKPTKSGRARILFIQVSPKRKRAEMVYQWRFEEYACSPYMGSVLRLPNGNILGHFSPELTSVEISPRANRLVQKTVLTVKEGSPTSWISYRAQRLYRRPIIGAESRIEGKTVRLTLWDTVPRSALTTGHVTLFAPVPLLPANASVTYTRRVLIHELEALDQLLVEVLSEPVPVRAHWLATLVELPLPFEIPRLYAVFTNADGIGNVARLGV